MTLQLPFSPLTTLSPLDGRYQQETAALAPYLSEFALIRTRLEVESRYLIALSEIGIVRGLTDDEKQLLTKLGNELTIEKATRVKEIEATTQHDVKAMELVFRELVANNSLSDLTEMIHFGLTSEDVNNLAYRLMLHRASHDIMIPAMDSIVDGLVDRAEAYKTTPMLARTHGQAAVPTTLGKELAVFATRLNKEVRELEARTLSGKLSGAVGNFNALDVAAPAIDWVGFSETFIKSLGLIPNLITTQVNAYEDMLSYLQNLQRLNGVLIDFDQDMWRYISDYWFTQEGRPEEVGSSTMPQKINPIKFENSEGNLGMANAIIDFFVRKLPVSRLQRDLSDSTVIRNLGVIFGHTLLAYKSTGDGLVRIWPHMEKITDDLNRDWSVLTEGVQTILRRAGVEDPYSLIKSLSRGKHIDQKEWQEWVQNLPIEEKYKETMLQLTPASYTGRAAQLTIRAIQDIQSSRKQ